MITLSNNNHLKLDVDKTGIHLDGGSEGFLKSVTDFLDGNQRRTTEFKKLTDSIKKLNVNNNPIEGDSLKEYIFNKHKKESEKK